MTFICDLKLTSLHIVNILHIVEKGFHFVLNFIWHIDIWLIT